MDAENQAKFDQAVELSARLGKRLGGTMDPIEVMRFVMLFLGCMEEMQKMRPPADAGGDAR